MLKKIAGKKKSITFAPAFKRMSSADLLAQQVEHIPFKDGVLGSSPRQITYKEAKKWQKTDKSSQYQ